MSLFKVFSRTMKTVTTETIKAAIKKSHDTFEGVLKKVEIISCEKGKCIAELKVAKEHCNPWKGMHGGLSATLVDSITTYALFTHEKCQGVPTVSVEIHVTYLFGAQQNDVVVITAETMKAGKTLAYCKCTITNKNTGAILVKGSHTKFILRHDPIK